jgi:putative pyruvate formate lyase activating enzyme
MRRKQSLMDPLYVAAHRTGRLERIAEEVHAILAQCLLCPRMCGCNRLKGEAGFCKTGEEARVYSYFVHHGEEPPISGRAGSGTIFFSNCNLACSYCQNYEFSQMGKGSNMRVDQLADSMLYLQKKGCHNINVVTPTHVLGSILRALVSAVERGLRIPLVYNTSGYERPEIIHMLKGIVDVYLADMRYGTSAAAQAFSCATDYPQMNQAAVRVMHEQVGLPVFDGDGIIRRGLIIRHLVLPCGMSGTDKVMKFLAEEISPETYVSLMSQYHPYYRAIEDSRINRRLSAAEYEAAQDIMDANGLHNGWVQEAGGQECLAGIRIKPVHIDNAVNDSDA